MAIPSHSTHTSLLRTLLFALDALRPRMMELLVRAILLLDASVWGVGTGVAQRATSERRRALWYSQGGRHAQSRLAGSACSQAEWTFFYV